MCGIFFISSCNKISPWQQKLAKRATDLLKHRGPDGHGIFVSNDGHTILCHTRLEIVGLGQQGHQPFIRNDKALIYNGEIYNTKFLKNHSSLKDEEFETDTDTEVLHKILDTNSGVELSDVDGMFAFAFWKNGELTVATDFFAEKPVFIYEAEGFVAGCSELGVLIELFNPKLAPRTNNELEFLAFGFKLDGQSFFEKVRQLKPSEIIRIRDGNIIDNSFIRSVERHRTHLRSREKVCVGQIAKKIRSLLIESIETRLTADVPVCLFLSAGVDSSIIAAIASKELGMSLKCVTVSFTNKMGVLDEEAISAQKIADAFGHEHCVIAEASEGNSDVVNSLFGMYYQPQDNPTAVAFDTMTRAIKGEFKVAMTGLGADEIFLGYGKHKYFWDRDNSSTNWLTTFRKYYGRYLSKYIKHGSRLERKYLLPNFENYLSVKNPGFYKKLILHPEYHRMKQSFQLFDNESLAAYSDFEISQILPFSKNLAVDVASMRNSVELRTPYLNYKLFEAITSLDPEVLCGIGQKHFLRGILRPYLPKEIMWVVKRAKTGFSHPIQGRTKRENNLEKSRVVWQRRNFTLEKFYNDVIMTQ